MQAVIMAAGKSTRTYPLTLTQPKPLIQIVNKPILAHQLDQLVGLVKEVILIVGYRSKMILDHFGYSYQGITLKYVEQREQLGTGHAAMQVRPYIRDRFILMNGDDLYARQDIEACLRYPYSVLGKKITDDLRKWGVIIVENGLVKDIVEKSESHRNNIANVGIVNVGVYVLDKRIFDILDTIPKSPRGEYEITEAIIRLAQTVEVHCPTVKGYWLPVGYPWHILNANDFMLKQRFEEIICDKVISGASSKQGRIRGIIEEGVRCDGNIFLEEDSIIRQGTYIQGNVYIEKGCVIGPNCYITGNTSIGQNCCIEHGVVVENSVIGQQCQIGPSCHISHSVLGENVLTEHGTSTMSVPIKTQTVTSVINREAITSDRKRFGVILGNHVHLQPHVVTYPGVKIAPDILVPPGTVVEEDIKSVE
jgi:bifunctional UDP-N-acetylglucosamine pyrophosphorylase/glucosamine-1-phosphate N-acetyltransferase